VAILERNALQQQCTAAIRKWDIALRERNEYREALAKVSFNAKTVEKMAIGGFYLKFPSRKSF